LIVFREKGGFRIINEGGGKRGKRDAGFSKSIVKGKTRVFERKTTSFRSPSEKKGATLKGHCWERREKKEPGGR